MPLLTPQQKVLAISDNSDNFSLFSTTKKITPLWVTKNQLFAIKVLAISDNSFFSTKKFPPPLRGGGGEIRIFPIKVLTISDNYDHFSFPPPPTKITPQKNFRHLSSIFTQISAHTNFHDPRLSRSRRKVRAPEERKRNNSVNRGH
jgi:hypothetical protein